MPANADLDGLRAAAKSCQGCHLHEHASQTVFSKGPVSARLVLVGEQPGDIEDRRGEPFVGPAGKLLDRAVEEAGLDPGHTYTTNAVKHFKFTRRGKKRIHDKPNRYEIEACRPWLGAELEAVHPEIVVVLGATAAQSLLGSKFRVTQSRGIPLDSDLARYTFATVHPASVLRAPDEAQREEARLAFFADLRVIGECYRRLGASPLSAAGSRS